MPNPASALGEAVGKAVEREIQSIIQKVVAPFGLRVDIGGPRKDRRKGEKLLLINETGNQYQIDTVVEDRNGKPLILVESKYLRYKKHNRDKASWTCVAHYKLRTTYPTVKKSIAVLMGQWSAPSQRLMQAFGVDTIRIPFEHMVKVLAKYGIDFNWPEKDSVTPAKSWKKYCALSKEDERNIATECLGQQRAQIEKTVLEAVKADPEKPKNVSQIELLIRTTHNEFYVKRFDSIRKTVEYLLSLTEDVKDLRGKL